MYTVEVSVPLRPGRCLTDDEITDLVEAIIDDLDTTSTDHSVLAAFQAANAVAGGTLAADGLRSEVRPLRAV